MEPFLSIDDLQISFSDDQELKFTDSRIKERTVEEACDLSGGKFSLGKLRDRQNPAQRSTSCGDKNLLRPYYSVANAEKNHYNGDLPSISLLPARRQLKNETKAGCYRGKPRCLDVDDFTVGQAPAAINSNTKGKIEEGRRWSGCTKRAYSPFAEMELCFDGKQGRKKGPLAVNSSGFCDLSQKCNLDMTLQTFSSEKKWPLTASPRNIFSPRRSFTYRADPQGRGKECSLRRKQSILRNLPEKVNEFIDVEISRIKGGEKVHSTPKHAGRAFPGCNCQERQLFSQDLIKLKNGRSSVLLEKRGKGNMIGLHNKGNDDLELSGSSLNHLDKDLAVCHRD